MIGSIPQQNSPFQHNEAKVLIVVWETWGRDVEKQGFFLWVISNCVAKTKEWTRAWNAPCQTNTTVGTERREKKGEAMKRRAELGDGKRDERKAGGQSRGWKAGPVARHSNLCVSKQDSQIYREDAGEQNKDKLSPNVTLKPSNWIVVRTCRIQFNLKAQSCCFCSEQGRGPFQIITSNPSQLCTKLVQR